MATDNTPLTLIEAPAAWSAHALEVLTMIVESIGRMGLSNALARVDTGNCDGFGRGPRADDVRYALKEDIGLHDRIYDEVYRQFALAVCSGSVWRARVGVFLNVVTRRVTWRFATARATELFAEVQPSRWDLEVVDLIPAADRPIDEVLAWRELRDVALRHLAALTSEERELLGLDGDRDYRALAERWGMKRGALRVRAHRLVDRLRAAIYMELGDADAAE